MVYHVGIIVLRSVYRLRHRVLAMVSSIWDHWRPVQTKRALIMKGIFIVEKINRKAVMTNWMAMDPTNINEGMEGV